MLSNSFPIIISNAYFLLIVEGGGRRSIEIGKAINLRDSIYNKKMDEIGHGPEAVT